MVCLVAMTFFDEESDGHEFNSADLFAGSMGVMAAIAIIWMSFFVDTQYGNLKVPEGHIAIPEQADYVVVDEGHLLVKKSYIESLEDERDFADAMGFPSFQGGKAGLVMLVDLTMDAEQRKSVQRMVMKMPADRLLVVGFGDKAETDSHRLFNAEEDGREAACQKIDSYSVSKHRRLQDALEAVLALQACTRVDLCLAGLPCGGGRETLDYLKRRHDLVPINCVDFSQENAEVSMFLQELVAISRGTYSKGA